MSIAYIGLGSNLDNPIEQLSQARSALDGLAGSHVMADSGMYESPAMTLPDDDEVQPDYLNAVVKLSTDLAPFTLLDALQAIETRQGRQRHKRWGARTLDLDILMYDDVQMNHERLIIPHPGMAERDFVLYPLQAIDKNINIPGLGALAVVIQHVAEHQLRFVGDFA